MQLILQRRADQAKNRARLTLTQADGAHLETHATEVQFPDGTLLYEQGKPILNAYRIKSGKVLFSRNGHKYIEAGPGWFLGDVLLVRGIEKVHADSVVTITAVGPVTLAKLNLGFVRELLYTDASLSVKFFRLLATKNTVLYDHVLANIAQISGTTAALSSSTELSPLSTSTGSVKSPHHQSVHHPSIRGNFKTYELLPSGHHKGVPLLALKQKKLKIMSRLFGLQTKSRIPYEKITSLSKIGENTVTITSKPKKATTIFFKTTADRDEFVGLVNALLPNACKNFEENTREETPAVEETALMSGAEVTEEDQLLYDSVTHEETYKKGDFLFQEGDLFQRAYTITSGSATISQNGTHLATLYPGDIIGVGTLLVLRPAMLTVQVSSETASATVMPAHRLFALIDNHVKIADRVFRNAASIQTRLCVVAMARLDRLRDDVNNQQLVK